MYNTDPMIESRTINFVGLSVVCHMALFVMILVMKITQPVQTPVAVEIEILPPQGKQVITPLVHERVLPQVTLPQPPVKVAQPKIKMAKFKAPVLRAAPSIRVSKVTQPAAPVSAPVAPPIAMPIEAPELETPDISAPVVVEADELAEDVLNDDFEKVDREAAKKVSAVKETFRREEKQALHAHDDSLSDIEASAKKESAQMAALAKLRRQNEIAALKAHEAAMAAAAQAAARAQALAAAQEAASQRASALAAAAAAKQAAEIRKGDSESAQGSMNGISDESVANNQGTAGAPAQNKYGVAGGVRSLEDIRQRPGNRKPYYDYEDRLRGRQGAIVVLAYVTKEGSVGQFKMMKSTGHNQLDTKTLNALKDWRFYPGQEGWVEIPFKWDLKGGPQEMPATLRRKITQN